ncbi:MULTISPECIES: hypothetical protein [Cysteiniphilum]|uniref:Uncharacterized protein n=1 Tax=Cysteiniphilum litorale TaxID=2056700 RepID=A0A8J3E8B9_9GAMM|nr:MULTISPECIES: hypothetical protein [Cysteiniphilum]GGF92158.1 hypothetical protein GCM10010995_06690 [Cysteiniphilum litorale]
MKKLMVISSICLFSALSANYVSARNLCSNDGIIPYNGGSEFPAKISQEFASLPIQIQNASQGNYYYSVSSTKSTHFIADNNYCDYNVNGVVQKDESFEGQLNFAGSFTEAENDTPAKINFSHENSFFISFYDPLAHKACAFSIYANPNKINELNSSDSSKLDVSIETTKKKIGAWQYRNVTSVNLKFNGC